VLTERIGPAERERLTVHAHPQRGRIQIETLQIGGSELLFADSGEQVEHALHLALVCARFDGCGQEPGLSALLQRVPGSAARYDFYLFHARTRHGRQLVTRLLGFTSPVPRIRAQTDYSDQEQSIDEPA